MRGRVARLHTSIFYFVSFSFVSFVVKLLTSMRTQKMPDGSSGTAPDRPPSLESVSADYFLKRAQKPDSSEPKPNSPRRGSGDAVCGSLLSLSETVVVAGAA